VDPISQGVCGALLSQALAKKEELRSASIIGFLAGVLPDADIFISSPETPITGFIFHRHFTHSLSFIPLGGLIAALLLFPAFRQRLGFKRILLFSILGYATHGLIDACTSYGTLLLWPFSDLRVSWNIISIIDPIFTGTICALAISAFLRRRARLAHYAIGFVFFYLTLGVIQYQRAHHATEELAKSRSHEIEKIFVQPTIGNLLLWRSVYENQGRFYADGIHLGLSTKFFLGESVKKFYLEEVFPELDSGSQLAKDVEKFNWFTSGFLSVFEEQNRVIGDFRYAMLPNSTRVLWGIWINPNEPNSRAQRAPIRRDMGQRSEFFDMLKARGAHPLE
jgi:inner membrane protein